MKNLIKVSDINISELDVYTCLNEPELKHYYEPYGGLFIAETAMIIERALDAGCQSVSVLISEEKIDKYKNLLMKMGDVPIYAAPEEKMHNLTGINLTRGIMCAMKRPNLKDPSDIIKNCRCIAVLDNVMNPTNVGAIFRSAAALGIEAILLTGGSSDPLYRRCIRVSMGTVFAIPWAIVDDDIISFLHRNHFTAAALALRDDSVSIDHPSLKEQEKLALLLGSEGYGLSPQTIDKSDYTVKIPMSMGVDSLNVAAASAVAFWELTKK